MEAVKIGQIQWILFWLMIFSPKEIFGTFLVVWIISLFFNNVRL